jgi:general secretion pathway protein I
MSDERGFTLLEVLVAFVIAAMAVAVLVEGTLGGLRSADVAGRYEEAIARARSRLAALGTNIVAGDTQGDDGGSYHWHLRVAPNASNLIASDVVNGVPATRTTLYSVSVAISWGEGDRARVVQLDTKRIGTQPAIGPGSTQ